MPINAYRFHNRHVLNFLVVLHRTQWCVPRVLGLCCRQGQASCDHRDREAVDEGHDLRRTDQASRQDHLHCTR
jgi:hypothetical protein